MDETMYDRRPIGHVAYYNAYKWSYNSLENLHQMGRIHGAKRVLAFFLLTTILPAFLIIIPLYLRHSVFADVIYPVAESDILAIVDGISPFFCESHTLKMNNSSFHAFQLSGRPKISKKRKHIRLKKSMRLPDDTLEYWGFYLLEGAFVELKACSRYDGSRILVVRGEKNLKTCGLLDHNLKKYGAKMDQEHSQVKVTFETEAEEIDVDNSEVEQSFNTAEEVFDEPRADLENHKKRHNNHHKRKIEELKDLLEENQREKRDVAKLDGHIAHGGNALNVSDLKSTENSVSSFETDLLTCYDGQILLIEGFPPSHLCTDVHYLQKTQKSNHIVTVHEVATSGYYYYIFYSDNDLVHNDIHAIFDIYKPTYRFANQSKGNDCINQTECTFPISFWSDDTVIVEVPTIDGIEHDEDHVTLLRSTCHPRMAVYVVFPISALFLILGCAFL